LPAPLSREDFATPEGRQRAIREFAFADHAIIRRLYRNTHAVAPGVWRSYQPSPSDLEKWARRGIKTIVNLRGPKPSAALFLEEEACERLGLRLVNFRVFSREAPSFETLCGARDLFVRIEYPALFHCKSGADRVGLMSALYLFFSGIAPLDRALEQLSLRYGHLRQGKTGVIDAAFEIYLDHAASNSISLDDVDAFLAWAHSSAYDPVTIKRDFKSGFIGNLLTEFLLRRE
jgi:protein tyrosine/serine phosphatase